MGLLGPGISEVIATTRGNAAPVGVIRRGDDLTAVLFRGSHTARNVVRDGWLVANVSHDPVVFVRTAFEDLPADAFVTVPALGWDRLAAADGFAACRAEILRETSEAYLIGLTVEREEILEARCVPANRGRCAVLEAAVHATRFRQTGDPVLGRLIRHHASIIRRCGGPAELEALALLLGYIGGEPGDSSR
ncbi:MAG: DUF447 family protein [Methanospirillum sp.]|nr:DUF447 family protein [Methanospirillum sp.]